MRFLIYDQDVNVGEENAPSEQEALRKFRRRRGYTDYAPLSAVPVRNEREVPSVEGIPFPVWEAMLAIYVTMFPF